MLIHVVQSGESLWQIASRYGVPLSRIVDVNQLPDPNHLVVGEAIIIPSAFSYHIVRAGETLSQIAQTYGTTVETLVRTNRLSSPQAITPGMRLLIPPRRHTVQSGETLQDIARRYNTTAAKIMALNGLTSETQIQAGMVLAIPGPKPTIDVNAFIYSTGAQGTTTLDRVGEHLTYVSPFAYRVQADGNLQALDDTDLIQAAYNNHVVPLMAITNFSATETGSQLAHTVLASIEIQNTLLTNIVNTMREKGYQGLNVDFENVRPEDREPYNRFLERARDRLHAENFLLSTSVAPKTSGTQQGLLYEAHDYPAQGRIVDFVVLMTYEWGYRLGPPRAISPVNLMRQVVEYAVSVIPSNKIMMGFSLYARDWLLPHVQGQEAETLSPQAALARAVQHNATIQYDQTAASPYYRYVDSQGRTHEVWFEDARSAQAKYNLVKEYNLRGVSYWVLGNAFPQNWVVLEDNFNVRKRV